MNQRKSSNGIMLLTLFLVITLILSFSSVLAKAQTSPVNIYSDSKAINLCNFNITDYTLYFNNLGDSAQVIQIIPEGSGANFITLSNNLLLLKPYEKETVKVFLNPNNKVGTYRITFKFIINNKVVKELTQTYVFKTCETFNASIEHSVTTCYKNKTSVNLNIKNERNEVLNLLIKYQNKEYMVVAAPFDSINTTVFGEYKKIGSFTDKIILEDETTKYSLTKEFNVNVNPCGAKFFSLSAFISSSFKKSSQFIIKWWKWILLVILLIILIILIILAIRRYKHKKEEEIKNKGNNEEKIEPVLDVIQGETDLKEVEKAKKPEVNHNEEKKSEEAKEASFVLEKRAEEERINASEVLAKEPYYKRVIRRTFGSRERNGKRVSWWRIIFIMFALIIILLLVILGIRYLIYHPLRINNPLNLTGNNTNGTIQNITHNATQPTHSVNSTNASAINNTVQNTTTNATLNSTALNQTANSTSNNLNAQFSLNLKPLFKDVWGFILLYKIYFLIGIIISIILILYCSQKGYPCRGKKIRRVKGTTAKSIEKTAKKTKRKAKKAGRKKKKSKSKKILTE